MRRPTNAYAAVLALGAASLLAACTTPPVTYPPSSTSTTGAQTNLTTTTSTPSTTAASQTTTNSGQSQIPEAARANTEEGAVAFTAYFADLSNKAYNELQPDLISGVSLNSCQSCKLMIDSITDWRSKGERYVGTFVNPLNVTISAFPKDNTAKVLLTTRTDGSRVLNANGAVVETYPPESGNVVYSLLFRDQQWKIETIKAAA